MCEIILKRHLLFVLYRHVHFELSSISCEISRIFGLQIMMYVVMFHFGILQLIIELYDNIVLMQNNSMSVFDIFCIFIWALRCFSEIVILNYICEGVCMKVKRELSLNFSL